MTQAHSTLRISRYHGWLPFPFPLPPQPLWSVSKICLPIAITSPAFCPVTFILYNHLIRPSLTQFVLLFSTVKNLRKFSIFCSMNSSFLAWWHWALFNGLEASPYPPALSHRNIRLQPNDNCYLQTRVRESPPSHSLLLGFLPDSAYWNRSRSFHLSRLSWSHRSEDIFHAFNHLHGIYASLMILITK